MLHSTIAHYRITAKLGEGGMGVVYRATDTKLDREVAIKVLPTDVAHEPDRLARFEREAKTLASLNHPNIAAIYGVEQAALVMELVEGPTLADRLSSGPLPLDDTIAIAIQIADALEAAHEKSIVHRDLKPANIKITPHGSVKLLDFGLAKAMESTRAIPGDPVNSPTLVNASIPGVIMGTAGYMAPEQAKGHPVDKRADIWAFGVVLFEMLTGRQLFDSGSIAQAIADVLRADIDLNTLPPSTPSSIRTLLSRCLDRNPKSRLRDIGEARILLTNPPPSIALPQPSPTAPTRPSFIPWAIAALLAAAIPAAWFLKPKPELPLLQFEIPQPEAASVETSFGQFALSPDRTTIVYRAAGNDQKQMLWLRRLSTSSWKPLPGTENATRPFWSPDGRSIGFFAEGKMKRIEADSGAVQILCDADPAGAGWSQTGEILFEQLGKPLLKVPASGGQPTPIFPGDTRVQDGSEFFLFPDGVHFLYDKRNKNPGSYLGSLKDQSLDRLLLPGQLANAKHAAFIPNPAGGGWLIHSRNGQLLAQTFDPASPNPPGPPVQIAVGADNSNWSSSSTALLAHLKIGIAPRQLSWVSRTGAILDTIGKPGDVFSPRIAPDQQYLLYSRDNTIIKWDLPSKSASTLTNATVRAYHPVPLPEDRFLVTLDPPRALIDRPLSGAGPERLLIRGTVTPSGLSTDRRWVLVNILRAGKYSQVVVPAQGGDPIPILTDAAQSTCAQFSPDGHYIVYSALAQGKRQVFVSTLPKEIGGPAGNPATWQISQEGGDQPVWRLDGKEIVYYDPAERMMSAPVSAAAGAFRPSPPVPLFPVRLRNSRAAGYDITPDGSRFLIPLMPQGQSDEYTIGFIQNWPKLLDRSTRSPEPE